MFPKVRLKCPSFENKPSNVLMWAQTKHNEENVFKSLIGPNLIKTFSKRPYANK